MLISRVPVERSGLLNWQNFANEMSFQAGWNEFIKDNHIQEGDLMIFKYNGNSCFKFSVFKGDYCERASSCVLENNSGTRQKSDDSVEILDVKPHNEVIMRISSDDIRSSSLSGQNNEASRNYQMSGVNSNKRMTRSNSAHQKKNLDRSSELKEIKQESDGIFSLEMFSCGNIYMPRKVLSDAEESKALMLIKSVRSRNPCFVSVMHPYSVSTTGRYFIIPSNFTAKYLPPQNMKVSLSIPGHRKKWLVNYTAGKLSGFCGNWNTFTNDSHLEKRDVCVFELVTIHGKYTMKVHIARAASSSIS